MMGLEENIFKSCLKRKVKFTASTFVKFLITGTVALSLTACGGGGGGGGSSSSGGNNVITKFPGVDNIIGQENIQNETNKIFDTDISSVNSKIGYTGLKVSNNSDVIIKQGRSIEILGNGGVTGVLVTGNSKVTNEGNIKIAVDYIQDDDSIQDDTFNTLIKYMSKGIFVTDRSTGINNGAIEIKGSATGILSYGAGSTGINRGTIKITGNGSTWDEAPTIGMASFYGGKAVNERTITGAVYGQMGMFSCQGELVNNGTIQLSENDSYGMVVQEGTAENSENGRIILSHGIGRDPNHYFSTTNEGIEVESGKGINKGKIEITNNYTTYNYDYIEDDFDNIADVGMYGGEGAELINEKTGVINISGTTAGMMIDGEYGGNNIAINNGKINLYSPSNPEMGSHEDALPTVGMGVEDGGKLENNNLITGNGTLVLGMASLNGNGAINTLINNGRIELSGNEISGIEGSGEILNNGIIHLIAEPKGDYHDIVGMDIWEANAVNGENGKIIIENKNNNYSDGVYIDEDGGKFTNKGLIEIVGGYGAGIDTGYVPYENGTLHPEWQKEAVAVNEKGGVITVIGTNTEISNKMYGMVADGPKASIINKGTINVNGKNSWGMAAFGGAKAENYGIINVGDTAAGGMIAEDTGSTISNEGTINISKDNKSAEALKAINGGKILNEGTIKTDAIVEIKTSGTYVIGTNKDGSYGKLSAVKANLDGNIVVESDIVKGNYGKESILENVVEAEDIKLGENVNFKSDSLLYNASVKKDVFGNLDAKLTRNDKNVSDFADEKFIKVSSIFDDYINNESEYNKLSSEGQEVIDTIFDHAKTESSLRNAVNQVTGTEYINIQKQIFDIKNNFKEYDNSVISTLDTYNFNVQFIGEYSEVDSKNGISGYENKMSGFNGAMKLSDNLYGVLGYGYSDIDYDGKSDGKIQTIHTGIYKDLFADGYKLRIGMYGEYNFHENNRAVLDKRAESEFNSYLAGVSGDVSRKYGEDLYIKPSLSLDISYGNVEKFDEEKAEGFNLKVDEQDYTSILPKAEIILGKDFENIKLFTSAEYSYELGDMDKDMTIELLNKKADVKNNEMEHGQFKVSTGGSISINNLSLNAELGKEFGRRDREYVKAGFSYKF